MPNPNADTIAHQIGEGPDVEFDDRTGLCDLALRVDAVVVDHQRTDGAVHVEGQWWQTKKRRTARDEPTVEVEQSPHRVIPKRFGVN